MRARVGLASVWRSSRRHARQPGARAQYKSRARAVGKQHTACPLQTPPPSSALDRAGQSGRIRIAPPLPSAARAPRTRVPSLHSPHCKNARRPPPRPAPRTTKRAPLRGPRPCATARCWSGPSRPPPSRARTRRPCAPSCTSCSSRCPSPGASPSPCRRTRTCTAGGRRVRGVRRGAREGRGRASSPRGQRRPTHLRVLRDLDLADELTQRRAVARAVLAGDAHLLRALAHGGGRAALREGFGGSAREIGKGRAAHFQRAGGAAGEGGVLRAEARAAGPWGTHGEAEEEEKVVDAVGINHNLMFSTFCYSSRQLFRPPIDAIGSRGSHTPINN